MNFNYGLDPLGIGVMGRGQQSRSQQHLDEMDGDINSRMVGGPLPNAAWDGLLQAMQEHHVGRVGQTSATPALPSTFNPAFQHSAVEESGPSTNMAAPGLAVAGLQQAGPSEPGYGVDHEEWMASKGRGGRLRVEDQKGTSPMNNSQRFRMPTPAAGGY